MCMSVMRVYTCVSVIVGRQGNVLSVGLSDSVVTSSSGSFSYLQK